MAQIAAIVEDLFFSVRLADTAARAGHQVTVIDSEEDWRDARARRWDLILVEALAERLPWERWLGEVDRSGGAPRVVAFGPHTQLALRDRALAAGADAFVPNGRVVGDLAAFLRPEAAPG